MKNLHQLTLIFLVMIIGFSSCTKNQSDPKAFEYGSFSLPDSVLADKIMGGWAGQVIGCTYGGPTEFRYNGTMINDYTPIPWDENRMLMFFQYNPGLYDDVYMDLTFVDVFDREGLDAPAESHALAFANADYALWHANQAARYNILTGIMPPKSGHWLHNPHSEDIDFQIEADFAGLMSPGMVNSATEICDRVGHIMNYGDGWYGGVYVAAMYSLAFVSNDIPFIVSEALKAIPAESDFYKCMSDVIAWHKEFPADWKRTWFECQRKWTEDIGCPDGVFEAFNIDAKINAAYIIIGLLYGEGDFGKTIDISTRCGQDSDCNPASSGGILATILGYKAIPDYWKQGIDKVEDMDFKYTEISLLDVYRMSHEQAVEMIKRNGGSLENGMVSIQTESPVPVAMEKGFQGHYPVAELKLGKMLDQNGKSLEFEFNGTGFIVNGDARTPAGDEEFRDLYLEVYIDGNLEETVILPTTYKARRHDLCWKFQMENGDHKVELKLRNPEGGYKVWAPKCIIYGPDKSL